MSGDHSLLVPLLAPLRWEAAAQPGADAGGAAVRALATAVSLAERPPQVNEEATGLELEVARLHQKTQLLVELLALALGRSGVRPEPTEVRLGGTSCQWKTATPPPAGSEGVIGLWLHPASPEPVNWPARIEALEPDADGATWVRATLLPLGEAAQAALDRHVFQLHRRAIAEARAQRQ
jgi:hypothetical protein